jgi:hypothetical protein
VIPGAEEPATDVLDGADVDAEAVETELPGAGPLLFPLF